MVKQKEKEVPIHYVMSIMKIKATLCGESGTLLVTQNVDVITCEKCKKKALELGLDLI